MNRIEIITTFKSMKALLKHKHYEELEEVMEATLAAAEGRPVEKTTSKSKAKTSEK